MIHSNITVFRADDLDSTNLHMIYVCTSTDLPMSGGSDPTQSNGTAAL